MFSFLSEYVSIHKQILIYKIIKNGDFFLFALKWCGINESEM